MQLGLSFLVSRYKTPTCKHCNMFTYNDIEDAKHEVSCYKNRCPYCITLNRTNDICSISFPNKSNFMLHMNLHKTIRRNPYLDFIKIKGLN